MYRLPIEYGVTPEQVRHAITGWMYENHAKIGFVRDISETIADWKLPHMQRKFCSGFCANPSKHTIEQVGVIPGFEMSEDDHMDLAVCLHKQPAADEWEVCFIWDSKQKPSGYRSQKADKDPHMVRRAFASMPEELWLPVP